MIDGNRHRELLTRVLHTISLGELGVAGFFLISGYLITKSFVDRPNFFAYLLKRCARIIPGYLVAFWFCVLFVAPLAGSGSLIPTPHTLVDNLKLMLHMREPSVAGVFRGVAIPALDGPMWTIAYEFRAYLAVLVGAAIVSLVRLPLNIFRWFVLAFAFIGLAFDGAHHFDGATGWHSAFFGLPQYTVRLTAIFAIGACFYCFRQWIPLKGSLAIIAAVFLPISLAFDPIAQSGTALFGGYLIFWFSLAAPALKLGEWAVRHDISYGVYLYAWPIQSYFLWKTRTDNQWLVTLVGILGASIAGWLSWHLIERRALDAAHRFNKRGA